MRLARCCIQFSGDMKYEMDGRATARAREQGQQQQQQRKNDENRKHTYHSWRRLCSKGYTRLI